MRRIKAAACLLATLAGPGFARASEPPTMVDLRSAYCTPINVAQKEALRFTISDEIEAKVPGSRKNLADTRQRLLDNIARLRSYIVPRAQYVDIVALTAATERGKADYTRSKEDLNTCAVGGAKALDACAEKSEALQRVRACQKVDWLPF